MPDREVHCADALAWMRGRAALPCASAVTSVPDVSEVGMDLGRWRAWFLEAAGLVVGCVPEEGVAVFFQTDVKKAGRWIDKAHLVARAAEDAGASCLFHKVVCRKPPGSFGPGRPGYTHMLAFSRKAAAPPLLAIPDVIDEPGALSWTRAVGVVAVAHAVRFARKAAPATTTILDPFCGIGTFLAVANALGLDAVGVERNRKRAAKARAFALEPDALREVVDARGPEGHPNRPAEV